MQNGNTYPEHIVEFANRMVAKGSAMTFEAICEMQMKSEAKKSKSSKKNWTKRDEVTAVINDPNFKVRSSEEMYAEASKNQRGSSMRD